jgi:hypothetical protein
MIFHKIKNCFKHFCNGIYSGIPICCCIHFIKEYYENGMMVSYNTLIKRGFTLVKTSKFSSKLVKLDEIEYQKDVNYVRCNKCHNKNFKKPLKLNGGLFNITTKGDKW